MLTQVADLTHVGEARRRAAILGDQANLDERQKGALAIVVTEMTTNILKHAGSGMVMLDAVSQNGYRGVRVLGLDSGRGIPNVGEALNDGFSSSGTAGNGLGAIKRLSTEFDIYSVPERGTIVLSEIWPKQQQAQRNLFPLQVGVVCAPIKGEEVSGDGWSVKKSEDSALFLLVDGLGHGVLAAEAAGVAERVFNQSRTGSLTAIVQDSHDALKSTRGAAMALASIDFHAQLLSFAGVGNIGASIVTPATSRGMVSHHGIVGHQVGKIQEFAFPWTEQSALVMHSDGLKTTWNLNHYPGIWRKHPALIAGVLYRDFARDRDDATVLIATTPAKAVEA